MLDFRAPLGAPSAQSKRTTIITRFSDAQQTHAECEAAACVAVTVRNTGQVAGEEVVQVPKGDGGEMVVEFMKFMNRANGSNWWIYNDIYIYIVLKR